MQSSPNRFEERSAAQAWLTSTFAAWRASLTEAERQAMLAYKLDAYEYLNEALRLDTELDDEDLGIVENLDLALARFRLPRSLIVFRGTTSEHLTSLGAGDVFVDYGYSSHSLLRVVAEDIVSFVPEDLKVIAEVLIPGGATVGAFVAAPDLVHAAGELEILLPRKTQFLIVRHAETIHMEVIP